MEKNMSNWGSPVEVERHNRIKLSVAAYAYEFHSNSIMSDADFDALCQKIDTTIDMENAVLDKFFREDFDPSTGMWIHKHPNLTGIERIYKKVLKWQTK
jgi:hypothetical protein